MNNKKTVRLAKMGMLVAISVVLAYFVHFPYVNLKAAAGNKKPYYVLLEDMIEPISLTVIEGKGK